MPSLSSTPPSISPRPNSESRLASTAPVNDHGSLPLVRQVCVFLLASMLLLMIVPELPWPMRLLLVAMTLVTLKSFGCVLLLVLVQVDLYFREGREFARMNGLVGIVFVGVVVSTLVLVARHRSLLKMLSKESLQSLLRSILKPAANADATLQTGLSEFILPCVRGILFVGGSVLAAFMLLSLLPNRRELHSDLTQLQVQDPDMQSAATIVVGIMAVWIVLGEIAWRRLSHDQGRMSLRSDLLSTSLADFRMIVRRRIRERRKRAVRQKGPEDDGRHAR